jgi:hypothetical protein
MPTVFKQAISTEIGTVPVDVLDIPGGVRATVIGCNLANITDYDTVNVNVYVIDENSTQAHYVRGLVIPPNTTAKVITQGEKLILPETSGINYTLTVSIYEDPERFQEWMEILFQIRDYEVYATVI